MPTVFRWKGYRFFWYQADGSEPPHVHIWKHGMECKVWLISGEIAFNHGFAPVDLRSLANVVADNRDRLLEVRHDNFGQ